MKYIALFRGINVGGNHKVPMAALKSLLEGLGLVDVSTYIASGNAVFSSSKKSAALQIAIANAMKKRFGFDVPTLIIPETDFMRIVKAIPSDWANDVEQKADVAFLLSDMDSSAIIKELPVEHSLIDMKSVPGAVLWRVTRVNQPKSRLEKIIAHRSYRSMTVRNVNTVRAILALL